MNKEIRSLKNRKNLITIGLSLITIGGLCTAIVLPITMGDAKDNKRVLVSKINITESLHKISEDIQTKSPLAKEGFLKDIEESKESISFKYLINDVSSDLERIKNAKEATAIVMEEDDSGASPLPSESIVADPIKGDVVLTFNKGSGLLEKAVADLGDMLVVLSTIHNNAIVSINGIVASSALRDVVLEMIAPRFLSEGLDIGILAGDTLTKALADKKEYIPIALEPIDISYIGDNAIPILPWSNIDKDNLIKVGLGADKDTLEAPKTTGGITLPKGKSDASDWLKVDKDKVIDTSIAWSLVDKTLIKSIATPWRKVDEGLIIYKPIDWYKADPSKVIKTTITKEVYAYAYGNKQYDTQQKAQEALSRDLHKVKVYLVNGKEFSSKDNALKEWLSLDKQKQAIVGDSFIPRVAKAYNGMPLSQLIKEQQGVLGYSYGNKVYPSIDAAKAAWLKEWSVSKKPAVTGSLRVTVDYQGTKGSILVPYDAKVNGHVPRADELHGDIPFVWDAGTQVSADGRKEYILSRGGKEILRYTPRLGKSIHLIEPVSDVNVEVVTRASLEEQYSLKDAPSIAPPKRYMSKPAIEGSSDLVELSKDDLVPGYIYNGKFYLDEASAKAALAKSFAIALSDSKHSITIGSESKVFESLKEAYAYYITRVTSTIEVKATDDADDIYS